MLNDELSALPLFRGMAPENIARLAPLFSHVHFEAGRMVFAQGDFAETVYVLQEGEVGLCLKPEDGGSLTIATLRPGDVFGWSAVLGRSYYTSGAVCRTAVHAIAVRGDQLRRAIRTDHELVELLGRMAGSVSGRFKDAQAQIAHLIHRELTQTES